MNEDWRIPFKSDDPLIDIQMAEKSANISETYHNFVIYCEARHLTNSCDCLNFSQ